eukprot:Platyproteum_vivax@DN2593_c0_g1_i2.p2
MEAVEKVAGLFKEGDRVVVVLPDSSRNYMSKLMSDAWLQERGMVEPEQGPTVEDSFKTVTKCVTYSGNVTPSEVKECEGHIVVADSGKAVGVVDKYALLEGKANKTATLKDLMTKNYTMVAKSTPMITVKQALRKEGAIAVYDMGNGDFSVLTQHHLLQTFL